MEVVNNMLIQCQDGVTFLTSNHIVCYEVMDSADGSAKIFAHTDDPKVNGPVELCRLPSHHSAMVALSTMSRKEFQGCANYSFCEGEV